MAKPKGTAEGLVKSEGQLETTTTEDDDNPRWGTWEELLLACAVNRYGTDDWDSVAVEIQKRSSSSPPLPLTPRNCRKKYLQLTRRFFTRNHRFHSKRKDVDSDDAGTILTTGESVPLLEELRKLRVAELRRELERYDLSIVSLQSKVKKMKEEREQSNSDNREQNSSDLCSKKEKETQKDHNEPDLEREVKEEPNKSPLSVAGKTVSDKDELSADESVSIDRRSNHDDTVRGGNLGDEGKEPDRTGKGKEEPELTGEEKPVAREEESCFGSSDSVEKEEPDPVQKRVKVEPESVSDSPELVESVAESKEVGGGDGGGLEGAMTGTTKEDCSDVQSSATKSRRDGDRDHLLRGSSDSPDDLENKSKSPAVKIESSSSVESQPLIVFLEDLKRQKLGSVFSRRLDSQVGIFVSLHEI